MTRYILTGAPGAGKTALIRQLERRGWPVVEEAATDVIALEQALGHPEPWRAPGFIDAIITLQRQRQLDAPDDGRARFFDRSPICTYALSQFLGFPPSAALEAELTRIARDQVYATRVFFIETLGFITKTPARQITYEDTLSFEAVHAETYARLGYDCVRIPRATPDARAEQVLGAVE